MKLNYKPIKSKRFWSSVWESVYFSVARSVSRPYRISIFGNVRSSVMDSVDDTLFIPIKNSIYKTLKGHNETKLQTN